MKNKNLQILKEENKQKYLELKAHTFVLWTFICK